MEISSTLATAFSIGLAAELITLDIVVLNADHRIKFHPDTPSGELCELSLVKNIADAQKVLRQFGLDEDPTEALFILVAELVSLQVLSSNDRHQVFNRLSESLGIKLFGPWDTIVGLLFELEDAVRGIHGNQEALETRIKDHFRVEILQR